MSPLAEAAFGIAILLAVGLSLVVIAAALIVAVTLVDRWTGRP